MSDVERKITQRVLGMLDEMNGPNGASMNHFWWNAVHPEFSEDFAYFDSIGQFHLGESELRKAFDVRAKAGHLHLGLTSNPKVTLNVLPGLHTLEYNTRLWMVPPRAAGEALNGVTISTVDDEGMMSSACASDVDPAGVEYDKKLLDAVLKMTGVPEGGFVEAREMFEGLVKAVNGGWDKVEPLLDADWAIFDGLKVYRGQAANDRLKALLTAGLKLNTAGPITTFTPSRVCAPVTRTITGLPESPVARMGVVFENGKVKTMLWGARSMDGMAWNRELAGKLGK